MPVTPACKGHDPEIWFPLPSNDAMESYAVGICNGCSLRVGCLGWAVEQGVRFGIWGGRNMENWSENAQPDRQMA